MGQLNNLYVSSSYQGLLKMTDSTSGLTSTLQTIQAGDGSNSPLQMSLTEVNISGSFFINNVPITNGTSGTSGTSGSDGTDGTSGSSGTDGSSGSSGTDGSSGSSGTNGTNGSNGTDGTSGTNGSNGTNGSSGTSGTNGTNGSNGTDGTSGTNGSNGTDGTSGTNGSNGTNGSSGSNGSSGTSGSNGTNGTSGISNSFFNYQAKTTITSGDPGSGHIIWNNATQTGSTQINVSDIDQQSNNLDVFLSQLKSGSRITLQDKLIQGNYQVWDIGTLTDNTIYWSYTVTLVSATHQFSNNDQILFIITTTPSGTSGTSGTGGSSGSSGTSPADLNRTGLITTGSVNTTQFISSSLIISGGSLGVGNPIDNDFNINGANPSVVLQYNDLSSFFTVTNPNFSQANFLVADTGLTYYSEYNIVASTGSIRFIEYNENRDYSYRDWLQVQASTSGTSGIKPIQLLRNTEVTGSVNITGQYLVNGVPFSGGTSGSSGTSGVNGTNGTSGTNGSSGTSGTGGGSGGGGITQITGITFLSSSWSLSSSLYIYDYSNTGITSSSFVMVIPSNSSITTVTAAQILPTTNSSNGSVRLFASYLPTGNISGTINIQTIS